MEKAEGTEGIATVDASKVKEENLEAAGGKCLRGFWLSALKFTGEIFNRSPLKVVFVTIKVGNMLCRSQNRNISQRLGSCLPPYFLLLWPMQSLPLSSTTVMADFTSFMLVLREGVKKNLFYGQADRKGGA